MYIFSLFTIVAGNMHAMEMGSNGGDDGRRGYKRKAEFNEEYERRMRVCKEELMHIQFVTLGVWYECIFTAVKMLDSMPLNAPQFVNTKKIDLAYQVQEFLQKVAEAAPYLEYLNDDDRNTINMMQDEIRGLINRRDVREV